MPKALTAERLRFLLTYAPDTGIFRWNHPRSRALKPGDIAGSKQDNRGYRQITVDGQKYAQQKLAWLYVHGEWPPRQLRFKDNEPQNCAIDNLTFGEFHYATKEGRNAYDRAFRKRNPEYQKHHDLKKFFGITLDQYKEMLIAQKGVCAICEQPETALIRGKLRALAVDHHHERGDIRGLLCYSCNLMIGHARENIETMKAAIAYLEKHAPAPAPVEYTYYDGPPIQGVIPLRKGAA